MADAAVPLGSCLGCRSTNNGNLVPAVKELPAVAALASMLAEVGLVVVVA